MMHRHRYVCASALMASANARRRASTHSSPVGPTSVTARFLDASINAKVVRPMNSAVAALQSTSAHVSDPSAQATAFAALPSTTRRALELLAQYRSLKSMAKPSASTLRAPVTHPQVPSSSLAVAAAFEIFRSKYSFREPFSSMECTDRTALLAALFQHLCGVYGALLMTTTSNAPRNGSSSSSSSAAAAAARMKDGDDCIAAALLVACAPQHSDDTIHRLLNGNKMLSRAAALCCEKGPIYAFTPGQYTEAAAHRDPLACSAALRRNGLIFIDSPAYMMLLHRSHSSAFSPVSPLRLLRRLAVTGSSSSGRRHCVPSLSSTRRLMASLSPELTDVIRRRAAQLCELPSTVLLARLHRVKRQMKSVAPLRRALRKWEREVLHTSAGVKLPPAHRKVIMEFLRVRPQPPLQQQPQPPSAPTHGGAAMPLPFVDEDVQHFACNLTSTQQFEQQQRLTSPDGDLNERMAYKEEEEEEEISSVLAEVPLLSHPGRTTELVAGRNVAAAIRHDSQLLEAAKIVRDAEFGREDDGEINATASGTTSTVQFDGDADDVGSLSFVSGAQLDALVRELAAAGHKASSHPQRAHHRHHHSKHHPAHRRSSSSPSTMTNGS